ncbi:MAG TPA: hypothetical protein VGD69_05235 [Herpetosiphonaceae bacterium]
MISLFLYMATALLTGIQVVTLFMWGIWGAPTSPLQCLSALGSLILFTASLLIGTSPRLAARVALAGTAIIWLYYGPTIPATISMYQQFSGRIDVLGLLMIFAPFFLLITTTGYALLAGFLVPGYISAPAWLVPEVVKPRTFAIFFGFISVLILSWLLNPFLKVSHKTVTHDMSWRCVSDSSSRCAAVILTYVHYPYRYERVESPALIKSLQENDSAAVTAQFEITREWGQVKNYRLERVEDYSLAPEEWSGGGYGCSNKRGSILTCAPGEQEWGGRWSGGSGGYSGSCGDEGEPRCGHEDARLASPWEE